MNSLVKISAMVKQHTGLDAACYGTNLFNGIVQSCFRASGLPTLRDYHRQLEKSSEAWQALVEALVVSETWFFRGRESFAALAKWVRTEWLPANPRGTLQLLSVPCSTGEEAYSLAMTLLDAGLTARNFRIDAVDISARAIAVAQQAKYTKNSFREKRLDFRERYFRKVGGHDVLHDVVAQAVHFSAGNLVAADFPARAGRYDVIFCRNLLIYFDRQTQQQVIESCQNWLAPGGLLFVGHAETGALAGQKFAPCGHALAFGFTKVGKEESLPALPPRNGSTVRGSARPDAARNGLRARRKFTDHIASPKMRVAALAAKPLATSKKNVAAHPRASAGLAPAAADVSSDNSLREVQRLADLGRLQEATALCQAHLRDQGINADALFWLGILHDAVGRADSARDCYRKVIYLQPDHAEALSHLALLAEKAGDNAQARGLRRRAERVAERSPR